MDEREWLQDALFRQSWRIHDDAMVWLVAVYKGTLLAQRELFQADLSAVAPEVDLDPSRAPSRSP